MGGGWWGVRVSDGQPKENEETDRYRDLHGTKWRKPRPMVSCRGVCVSVGQSNKIKKETDRQKQTQRERETFMGKHGGNQD